MRERIGRTFSHTKVHEQLLRRARVQVNERAKSKYASVDAQHLATVYVLTNVAKRLFSALFQRVRFLKISFKVLSTLCFQDDLFLGMSTVRVTDSIFCITKTFSDVLFIHIPTSVHSCVNAPTVSCHMRVKGFPFHRLLLHAPTHGIHDKLQLNSHTTPSDFRN